MEEYSLDDITFLQQCGVQVDPRWLAEQVITTPESRNYMNSLFRITDILQALGTR